MLSRRWLGFTLKIPITITEWIKEDDGVAYYEFQFSQHRKYTANNSGGL